MFGELRRELCPQGILHTVLVLDRSCWCFLVPVPNSAEEWAKLSLPPLAAHSSALQVWKLRWDHGAVAGPQLPSLQAPQRVLSATPGTTEPRFPFFSWGRAAVCVCGAFQWRALFSAGFGSALNLLRISSSLAVGWENRVVAVCGTERLVCVPQPVPGVLLVGTSFLPFSFFFFSCSLLWFTAIFPMPGRHNIIFHTNWRGGSRGSRAEPGGWRWQALAPPPPPASPRGHQRGSAPRPGRWKAGRPCAGSSSNRDGEGRKQQRNQAPVCT